MAKKLDPRKKPTPEQEIPPLEAVPSEDDALLAEEEAFAELMADAGAALGEGPAAPPPGDPTMRLPPESAVNLGEPAAASPPPPSGESSFEWANLAGSPPSSGSAPPARFDAPSHAA